MVASSPRSTSADPSAVRHSTSPSRNTAALTDGMRCSDCAVATSRSSRSTSLSGGDTSPEGLRCELDRAVDRLVVDVEVRHRADDRRVDRRREADAHLARAARAPRRVRARAPRRRAGRSSSPPGRGRRAARPRTSPPRAAARGRGPRPGGRRGARARRRRRRRRSRPAASRRRTGASRATRARSSRADPASTAPSGQPSPFERQSVTVSNSRPISAAGTPVATEAFRSRAPSRCVAETALAGRGGQRLELVERPARVRRASCACSRGRARQDAGRPTSCSATVTASSSGTAEAPVDARRSPRSSGRRAPPRRRTRRSRHARGAPRRGRRPGGECSFRAIWFASVAVGRKSAASCPSRAAARSCSALTVGSSRRCSSPTSAAAIAARIPAVGRVAVSERRSITRRTLPLPRGSDAPRATRRRARRARVPGPPGLGMGRPGRRGVRRDDERPAGPARGARAGRPVLDPRARDRAAVARRHGQDALPDARRPPRRGGADALPGRPSLRLRLVAVRLPAHVHVLRDRPDGVRTEPDVVGDPRPGAPLPPRRSP